MANTKPGTYDPESFSALTFHDAVPDFVAGSDNPRAYLERCLETIEALEPVVQAFAALNVEGARQAADESTHRYKAGKPLSLIDGMPIGIKDLLETKDMPTQMGCEAYKGHFPKNDNAAVWALRKAGALILGKTVTAELGGDHPGPTTNPFHRDHTPGGSSSGSAAAIAARMIPAAIGSQVGGSIIRPSGYCGNFSLKPTMGAINRGERQSTSMSTHGIHAGCYEDMWQTAIEIAKRVGGDPGYPGLYGPDTPPPAVKPERLIVIETQGWAELDDAGKGLFTAFLENLEAGGIELLRRSDHYAIEEFEQSIADARSITGHITSWEGRWAQRNLVNQHGDKVSKRTRDTLVNAETWTHSDYRAALQNRKIAQMRHANLAPLADAIITLACPGPAPVWLGDIPGQPPVWRPTGDSVFNSGSSLLFAPCVTLPLMAMNGLPVGAQLIGQQHQDAQMTALARWTYAHIESVTRH